VLHTEAEVVVMKKIIFATVISAFAFGASAAYACDGKNHAKGDKSDQADTQQSAKKDKSASKSDQKS
jgi:hypothetical protein